MPDSIPNNLSQIEISDQWLEDYKKTAIKWRKELLELPIASAQDVLKYMHGISGLRGAMRFPSIESDSQFGPYDPDRVTKALVNIDYRELETHFGSVIEKFHPNDYAMLTMGYTQPTRGDGQKKASATLLILSQLAKARGKHLASAVFNGKRKADGTTTNDLFDGFHTIAEAEIASGNLSAAKGNLYSFRSQSLSAPYPLAAPVFTGLRRQVQRVVSRDPHRPTVQHQIPSACNRRIEWQRYNHTTCRTRRHR